MSHPGLVRTTNQDQFIVGQIERTLEISHSSLSKRGEDSLRFGPGGDLLVVADGVGGSAGGVEASSLAVDTLLHYVTSAMRLYRPGVTLEEDLLSEFAEAIRTSHARVRGEAERRPELSGMATTLTMAYVLGRRAYVGHVGDSRLYLLHDGRATRITKDQTYAQVLVDRGVLEPDAAESSRWSHVLSSAVGSDRNEAPEILTYRLELQPGDSLVLCTDGLTKHVSDEEIARLATHAETAETACQALIDAALDGGGTDNVTVVVGKVY